MEGSPIAQTLVPVTHDLGGVKVHRTLPHKERTTVGPFIFFDQMGPAGQGGLDRAAFFPCFPTMPSGSRYRRCRTRSATLES